MCKIPEFPKWFNNACRIDIRFLIIEKLNRNFDLDLLVIGSVLAWILSHYLLFFNLFQLIILSNRIMNRMKYSLLQLLLVVSTDCQYAPGQKQSLGGADDNKIFNDNSRY